MKIHIEEQSSLRHAHEEILNSIGFLTPGTLVSLMQASEDVITLISPQGRVLYLADAPSGAQKIGDDWTAAWPAAAETQLRNAFARCLDETLIRLRLACETDGRDRLWEIRLVPVPRRNGTIGSVLSLSRDITANDNAAPGLH
ncbi:MAG: PAS domain-containing protein [Pseudomonadota bacterium]